MLPSDMAIPKDLLGAPRNISAESEELARLRAGFGLTQAQMAQVLGVNTQTYHRWERGRECPVAYLELMRCWGREEGKKRKR